MICKNCGMEVNDFSTNCPNCGAYVAGDSNMYGNNTYQNSNQAPIKTTGLLVWSIIELVCLSPIFGLIALILYFVKLRPAVDSGNINEIMKEKRTIKILLWVGIGLGVIPILLIMMLVAIPNTAGIVQRQRVRTDIIMAEQVCSVVRAWYVDAKLDPMFSYNTEEVENGFVKLDEIDGIDTYIFTEYIPTSYIDNTGTSSISQHYYATIINEDESGEEKVVVAIASEDDNLNRIYNDEDDISVANYDGIGVGIAYIEP